MSRTGAVTFKGNPMTLAGQEVAEGSSAPPFKTHYFADGQLKEFSLDDLKGKPSLVSVVPSLDTGVCQTQTKQFNQQLGQLAEKVNAVTVSVDLPFAQNRFCGAEDITNIQVISDYQERSFGHNWGVLIDELKILARAVFVLDAEGKIVHAQVVKEVTDEPDYDAALNALKSQI